MKVALSRSLVSVLPPGHTHAGLRGGPSGVTAANPGQSLKHIVATIRMLAQKRQNDDSYATDLAKHAKILAGHWNRAKFEFNEIIDVIHIIGEHSSEARATMLDMAAKKIQERQEMNEAEVVEFVKIAKHAAQANKDGAIEHKLARHVRVFTECANRERQADALPSSPRRVVRRHTTRVPESRRPHKFKTPPRREVGDVDFKAARLVRRTQWTPEGDRKTAAIRDSDGEENERQRSWMSVSSEEPWETLDYRRKVTKGVSVSCEERSGQRDVAVLTDELQGIMDGDELTRDEYEDRIRAFEADIRREVMRRREIESDLYGLEGREFPHIVLDEASFVEYDVPMTRTTIALMLRMLAGLELRETMSIDERIRLDEFAALFNDWDNIYSASVVVWGVVKSDRSFPIDALLCHIRLGCADFLVAALVTFSGEEEIDITHIFKPGGLVGY